MWTLLWHWFLYGVGIALGAGVVFLIGANLAVWANER